MPPVEGLGAIDVFHRFLALVTPLVVPDDPADFVRTLSFERKAPIATRDGAELRRFALVAARVVTDAEGDAAAMERVRAARNVLAPPPDRRRRRRQVKAALAKRRKARRLASAAPELLELYDLLLPIVRRTKRHFERSLQTEQAIVRWAATTSDFDTLALVPYCKINVQSLARLMTKGEAGKPSNWLEERLGHLVGVSSRTLSDYLKAARAHRPQR